MQTATWLTFGISGAITRTAVHFFPASLGSGAPYPAQCQLTLITGGSRKSVQLDGARLGQPDGVWVEDAFPVLREQQGGLFGLEVTITTSQPRVDLGASAIVMEFASRLPDRPSLRFWPINAQQSDKTMTSTLLIRDPFMFCTVIAVNGSAEPVTPALHVIAPAIAPSISQSVLTVSPIEAGSVSEIQLNNKAFDELPARECSWGLSRSVGLVRSDQNPGVSYAVVYWDASSKRPNSVSVL